MRAITAKARVQHCDRYVSANLHTVVCEDVKFYSDGRALKQNMGSAIAASVTTVKPRPLIRDGLWLVSLLFKMSFPLLVTMVLQLHQLVLNHPPLLDIDSERNEDDLVFNFVCCLKSFHAASLS